MKAQDIEAQLTAAQARLAAAVAAKAAPDLIKYLETEVNRLQKQLAKTERPLAEQLQGCMAYNERAVKREQALALEVVALEEKRLEVEEDIRAHPSSSLGWSAWRCPTLGPRAGQPRAFKGCSWACRKQSQG